MRNFFLLHHNQPKKGMEGVSFYYSNVELALHLRYARFQKGDVSALVSSKHSEERIKTLLGKPKHLWIFHCCGFKVLDFYFNCWEIPKGKGSHYQYSNDGNKWKDYRFGTSKEIDKLFKLHHKESQQGKDWINQRDYELILEPHFEVRDITSIYREKVFNLEADFGSGMGGKRFPENYLKKLAFFDKFKFLK